MNKEKEITEKQGEFENVTGQAVTIVNRDGSTTPAENNETEGKPESDVKPESESENR